MQGSKYMGFFAGIVIVASLSFQCRKFEDDPELMHFRSVKNRVIGYKVIEQDITGSTDMMANWKKSFGDFYFHFSSEPYRPDTTGYGYRLFLRNKTTNEKICDGEWGFKSVDELFWRLDCFDTKKSRFYPNRLYSWRATISRLSDKEMRVKGPAVDSLKASVDRVMFFGEYRR